MTTIAASDDSSVQTGKGQRALDRLIAMLRLERVEDTLFRGARAGGAWNRLYGGQVLGQALSAASQTVEADRAVHSLHSYFLLAGDPQSEVVYEVERVRDGGSFTTRRVKAVQHGRAIFVMSASFHKHEESFDHQSAMPSFPQPESLPSAAELIARYGNSLPDSLKAFLQREAPIEMRAVDPDRYVNRGARAAEQAVWFRSNGALPPEPGLHSAVLAYASDFTLLDTALIQHGKIMFDADVQLASIDHAMWFHRPFKADEWLLYVQESPSASGARGFCRGTVFDASGRLVASTAQEGLMRRKSSAFVLK